MICQVKDYALMTSAPNIQVPRDLLPSDGRFGSGPSKVRDEAMRALFQSGHALMGTSHRKSPIKALVSRLRDGLRTMYDLPDDYEIVIANGGATLFWDALVFNFIDYKSQHVSFGEFSAKFARHVAGAPFLEEPEIIRAEFGRAALPIARGDVDTYALIHNETSTGVMMPIQRPVGAEGLVVVDATSAAGGMLVDASQYDAYYFSPQKCLASDGGLWIAFLSPAAISRIQNIESSNRWIPESLRLTTAIENSRLNQTYNTLAIATVFLAVEQIDWINQHGGISWAASRSQVSTDMLYAWAENTDYTTPFVTDAAYRSTVVATIDFIDDISAATVVSVLAANGIVDTGAYGKLDRNQLRIAAYPAVDPEDVRALTQCIDYVVARL